MPYQGEFAQYKPLQRLVESERVSKLLGNYKIRQSNEQDSEQLQPIPISDLEYDGWTPDWILAIDGSHAEVDVQNGFPGAEASYLTVASVLINLAKTYELDKQRPVDPKEFRKLEEADSIDWALPGCNVISEGETSATASLRKSVFELFGDIRMSVEGESLLDTYEALLNYKPVGQTQNCPYHEVCFSTTQEFVRGRGCYTCNCLASKKLYSTDALRVHERFNPMGANGAIFGEIMQVIERVWIIHVLRTFEAKKWLSSLRKLAIILDGPLAVFGQPAWISQAIFQELSRLNQVVRKVTGKDLLLIGIEKSGVFVDHFMLLDRFQDGQSGRFLTGSVGLITDEYIKRNIIFSDSERAYGHSTYFGRKFLFKSNSGAFIVASLPFFSEAQRNSKTAEPFQYPRLPDAVHLLDKLISSRYENALTPIVAAHAEAAIPLSLGTKVLERLARELTSKESS